MVFLPPIAAAAAVAIEAAYAKVIYTMLPSTYRYVSRVEYRGLNSFPPF